MGDKKTTWHAFTGVWFRDGVNSPSNSYEEKVETPPWRNHWLKRLEGKLDSKISANLLNGQDWEDTFRRGKSFVLNLEEEDDRRVVDLVNAALYLQRPILVKGDTGVGKSSLAFAIAAELGLGPVIYWPITSHSTIKDGLYRYDIIRHLQETKPSVKPKTDIGVYFALKQLGIAFGHRGTKPRVLLIDEIDKADMDLPNDLLHVLEEGKFQIDELAYRNDTAPQMAVPKVMLEGNETTIDSNGWVTRGHFPVIVMTSNREREFPEPFLRRCITIELKKPGKEKLNEIVYRHFNKDIADYADIGKLMQKFLLENEKGHVATDRLLNAIHIYNIYYKSHGARLNLDSSLVDEILGVINQNKK
jgi:MoxR-like ATPase